MDSLQPNTYIRFYAKLNDHLPRRQQYRTLEYPLPNETNIRSVWVDESTTPPTFWTGSNHGAALVKVEPLD